MAKLRENTCMDIQAANMRIWVLLGNHNAVNIDRSGATAAWCAAACQAYHAQTVIPRLPIFSAVFHTQQIFQIRQAKTL